MRFALCVVLAAASMAAPPSDVDLDDLARFGSVVSSDAILRCSTTSPWDEPEHHLALLGQGHEPFAFHTAEEERPWVQIDLGKAQPVTAVWIRNRTDGNGARTTKLVVSVSGDGNAWNEVATVEGPKDEWSISLLDGENPRTARYVRVALGTKGYLHLSQVRIHGRGGSK